MFSFSDLLMVVNCLPARSSSALIPPCSPHDSLRCSSQVYVTPFQINLPICSHKTPPLCGPQEFSESKQPGTRIPSSFSVVLVDADARRSGRFPSLLQHFPLISSSLRNFMTALCPSFIAMKSVLIPCT
uniref:Uncharacterized protein n=1 Tax=Lygus hesperus TaxID=30085 RepID=A0A146M3F1_LYGHE